MGWNANLFMTLKEKFYPKNWENYPFKWLASLLSVTAVPLVNLSKGHTSVWAVIKSVVYRSVQTMQKYWISVQCQSITTNVKKWAAELKLETITCDFDKTSS